MNTIYFLPPAFFVQYTVTAALLSARACAPFFVAHMALRGGPVENPWKEGRFDVRRVFGKVPSSENLAAAKGAASSTR